MIGENGFVELNGEEMLKMCFIDDDLFVNFGCDFWIVSSLSCDLGIGEDLIFCEIKRFIKSKKWEELGNLEW